MHTIARYIECLYDLEGCSCGGLLHIMLDDNNLDDKSILVCLKECLSHPEREESKIGVLICEEYLKLSMEERFCLTNTISANYSGVCFEMDCKECPMINYIII